MLDELKAKDEMFSLLQILLCQDDDIDPGSVHSCGSKSLIMQYQSKRDAKKVRNTLERIIETSKRDSEESREQGLTNIDVEDRLKRLGMEVLLDHGQDMGQIPVVE